MSAAHVADTGFLVALGGRENERYRRVRKFAEPLDYTVPLVSRTMDGVKRYIANADDRPEDEIERADAALGGLAAQLLAEGSVTSVYVYTPDIAAGEGIETAFASKGYGDAIAFVNAFRFIEDLV